MTNNTIRTRESFEAAMESLNRRAEWDAKNRTYTWKRQFMEDEFHFFDADDKIVWVEGGHDFDVTLEWLRKLDAEEREVEREELAEREGDYITEYWDDLCPYTAEDYGVDADEDWSSDYPPVPDWTTRESKVKELIVTVVPKDDLSVPEYDFTYNVKDGDDIDFVLDELNEDGFDVICYSVNTTETCMEASNPDIALPQDFVDEVMQNLRDEIEAAREMYAAERSGRYYDNDLELCIENIREFYAQAYPEIFG